MGLCCPEESPVYTFGDDGTYTVVLAAIVGPDSVFHHESITVSSPVDVGDFKETVPQNHTNPTSGIVMINLEG